MAFTSTRKTIINLSGGQVAQFIIPAATNNSSPAEITIETLASGANTITVPTGGTTPTAVTIVPPAGNTISITLKGVTGDTGVRIHDTDPTTLALDPSVTTFVLTTASALAGVRFYWS